MALIVAGKAADFSTDTNIQVKDEITDNWSNAKISSADIKFGTTWFDAQGANQVHIIPQSIAIQPLGNQWEFKDIHDIHIFSTSRNNLFLMEQTLTKVLLENFTAIGSEGIQWGLVSGPRYLPEPKHRQRAYHSVMTIELYYNKVDT